MAARLDGSYDIMNMADPSSKTSSLRGLQEFGQSIWLDYIRRDLITSGELRRLVDDSGLTGITANPAIFEKAIVGSTDYDEALDLLARHGVRDAKTVYEALAISDIQDAADILRSSYDRTEGRDGFVSLEVSPLLAHDTRGTVDEARRLWATIKRDNVMVKVPGTIEGVPAVRQLTEEGINVNITLLFSRHAYEAVAEAYLAGLESRSARGHDIRYVASVASFFISRIDTAVDTLLANRLKTESDPAAAALLESLLGKVAIANAKLAYQWYRRFTDTHRWKAVAGKGARTQRLLWASTSTKNRHYRDVRYVEELIGTDTINTLTPTTLEAFRDHGRARSSVAESVPEAFDTMAALSRAGISLDSVTAQVLDSGIETFVEAFEGLLEAIERKLSIIDVHRDSPSHSGR
jgi:transaldolase / glucose-6-phosphate isomerase